MLLSKQLSRSKQQLPAFVGAIRAYWTKQHIETANPIEFPRYLQNTNKKLRVAAEVGDNNCSKVPYTSVAVKTGWAKERIANAKPIEYPKRLESSGKYLQHTIKGSQFVTEVDDDDRTKFPYNSVGKLSSVRGGKKFQASAWVANVNGYKNIICTCAHALSNRDGESERILFIPAIKNDGTQPYKSFEVIDGGKGVGWFVHPNWDPIHSDPNYDIGMIKLKKNADDRDVGDILPSLDINFDAIASLIPNKTKIQIIGYVDNRMYESTDTFMQVCDQGRLIIRNGAVKHGMSGGPWLLSCTEAITHQTHVREKSNISMAPYYSRALMDDLLNQM